MGVCQSCRLLPATIRQCGNCGDHAAKVCGHTNEHEHNHMVGVHTLSAMNDRCPGSDPVGAIFEETLENLGALERELMLFCATPNVLAVRWLLHLGAHWDAQDSNGSTCLHVACRAGSLQVVTELLSYDMLLHTTDIAKWTPLHIAAFMGRREAVVRLLRARASPNVQNLSRQSPADLCLDFGTLAALKGAVEELECDVEKITDETTRWRSDFREDTVGSPLECEHIPFFLPPVAAIRCGDRQEDLWRIGVLIFNKQPSYGLAFTVAAGLATTYADALLKILQRSNVNRAQVGGFLGEALSLSFLTRLSLFDSIPLWNTGIVQALKRVFSVFHLPEDFQKINRLLGGVAQVWWRKHQTQECPDDSMDDFFEEPLKLKNSASSEELSGLRLKAELASADVLIQLMFSTVLAHWFIHGDGHSSKRELKLSNWMMLNTGLGGSGGDLPTTVQQQIHAIVSRDFIKELALAAPRDDADDVQGEAGEVCAERFAATNSAVSLGGKDGIGGGGPDEGAGLPRSTAWLSALSSCAVLEGWVEHRPIGITSIMHGLPSSMSEVPYSLSATAEIHFADGRNCLDSAMNEVSRTETLFLHPPKNAKMWLSLCGSLLFFWAGATSSRGGAASSSATPHMFLDLLRTRISRSPPSLAKTTENGSRAGPLSARSVSANVITIVGIPDPAEPPSTFTRKEPRVKKPSSLADTKSNLERENSKLTREDTTLQEAEPLVSVIHLLPDGRWQDLHLASLELSFPTEFAAQVWAKHMSVPPGGAPQPSCRPDLDGRSEIPQTGDVQEVYDVDVADIPDSMPFPCPGDLGRNSDGTSVTPTSHEEPQLEPTKSHMNSLVPHESDSAALPSQVVPNPQVSQVAPNSAPMNQPVAHENILL